MPLYEYQCKYCGKRAEAYRPMSASAFPHPCSCGNFAARVLSPTPIRTDLPGYQCPVTGNWIEGRKAHEENLKRNGCHVLEGGEKEAAIRERELSDRRLEDAVAETAAREVAAMPPEKQRQLGDELSRMNPSYERG